VSAIYGLARFDDRPHDPRDLRAMREAIAYWGPDGGGAWEDDRAGFGQLVTYDGPASMRERGPLTTARGAVVTAAARLDNRDELLDVLAMARDATESQIVAAAWEKWGEESRGHLHGDWAFAVWNPLTRRLFLARDQFGHTALYYHHDATSLAFGSSRKALFALPHVPRRLGELRLVQHLVLWVTDGAATVHEEIFRLPPGHSLTATASSFAVERYWRPEDLPEVRLSNDDAYVERFLELYAAAVRTRLRTARGVATTLSSGLDSGSVTALAARELRRAGKTMIAFTSVPLFAEAGRIAPRLVVDEWPLAHATAEWCGGIDHRAVRAERLTPLQALERSLCIHDEPEYAAGNLHWILSLLEESRHAGAGVLLTGQVGNGGVSWSGDQLRVQRALRTGRWIEAVLALSEWRRSRRTSWARAAWAQVVRPMRALLRAHVVSRGRADMLPASIVNPRFAERMRVVERMRESGYDLLYTDVVDVRAQRLRVLLPGLSPNGALWHESSAAFGLEVRDPTADVRLLEFCLGIPDDQYARGGRDRWLIRRAMEGLLPPAVQWNVRRGTQTADLPLRLRADRGNVDALVAEIAGSPAAREYLDVDTIVQRWSAVQGTLNPRSFIEAILLTRALLFGLFLTRSKTLRP